MTQVIITLDQAEAVLVGHTLRALARARPTILNVAIAELDVLARVGDALIEPRETRKAPPSEQIAELAAAWMAAESTSGRAAEALADLEHAYLAKIRRDEPPTVGEIAAREAAICELARCCEVEEKANAAMRDAIAAWKR